MTKLFIRFFICVCISLFSGYNTLYAKDSISETNSIVDYNQDIATARSLNAIFHSNIQSEGSHTFKLNDKSEISDNENEEEEISVKIAPLKKLNTLANHVAHLIYSDTNGFFSGKIKKSLPRCKHIYNFPTLPLHVIFGVFRI